MMLHETTSNREVALMLYILLLYPVFLFIIQKMEEQGSGRELSCPIDPGIFTT